MILLKRYKKVYLRHKEVIRRHTLCATILTFTRTHFYTSCYPSYIQRSSTGSIKTDRRCTMSRICHLSLPLLRDQIIIYTCDPQLPLVRQEYHLKIEISRKRKGRWKYVSYINVRVNELFEP